MYNNTHINTQDLFIASQSNWREQPISSAQIDMISSMTRALGIYFSGVTCGEASDFIAKHISEYLASNSFHVSEKTTKNNTIKLDIEDYLL